MRDPRRCFAFCGCNGHDTLPKALSAICRLCQNMLWRLLGCALRCAAVSRALFFPCVFVAQAFFRGHRPKFLKRGGPKIIMGVFTMVHCPRACSEVNCVRGRLVQRPACLATTR